MAVGKSTYISFMIVCLILGYGCCIVTEYITTVLLISIGIYVGSKAIPRGRVCSKNKAVFITGCDTGFGHNLALRLDQLGYLVYAGCLHPESKNARILQSSSVSKKLTIVACDVTSDESVLAAKEKVQRSLPSEFLLWAIVNNAGIWSYSEIEIMSLEAFKSLAEVNVFGTVRITKAFLPMVRRYKGRVVNVGSISGMCATPGNAAYCMTKYAIECFTDSLRYEMRPWGVKVSLIQPGQYGKATNIGINYIDRLSDEIWQNVDEDVKKDYGKEHFDAFSKWYKGALDMCYGDDTPVINNIVDSITSQKPRHRYLVGGWYITYFAMFSMTMLPSWLGDRQFNRMMERDLPLPALVQSKLNPK